ncbi:MAG: outer membrane beta-barrel protein [Flavobacteriales bacterium]
MTLLVRVLGLLPMNMLVSAALGQSTIYALGGPTFPQPTPIVADMEDVTDLSISATPGFHLGFQCSIRTTEESAVTIGLFFEQRNYQEEFTRMGGGFSSGSLQSRRWEEKARVSVGAQFLVIPLTIGTGRTRGFGVRGGLYMAGLLSSTGSQSTERITSVTDYVPMDTSWVEIRSEQRSAYGDGIRDMHWGMTLGVGYAWKYGLFFGATGYTAPLGVSDMQLHDAMFNCSAQISVGWLIILADSKSVENSQ